MKYKMFSRLLIAVILLVSAVANAETSLEVTPSATEISEGENLSIEFKASVDEYKAQIEDPEFDAPDFDQVNAYASSVNGMQTYITNGSVYVKRTKGMTVVLHPRKTGRLTVKNIRIKINGKTVKADDLSVTVSAGAAARKGGGYSYQNQQQGTGLPGSGVRPGQKNTSSFFLKTEPSKLRAYKGEQIVLTYALYTQVPILGIQVERYPTVPGFLKEDLDIPLLSNRLQYSRSVLGGREYGRAPLAQYAIFPVKEGKLTIDSLTGKFSYRSRSQARNGMDDDDAFGVLNQFLSSMQTSTDSRSSDHVTVEVLPLPAAGQPKNFSGLVGDFEITAVVDKYTLKAGEPLNIKVKVEGKGHAGSLEHLNVEWPKDFEQYEDKSSTQYFKTGRSERIFDFMLIPRVKGDYTIPEIELSMFDPQSARYQTRKTQAIKITVTEGVPGSESTASRASPTGVKNTPVEAEKKDIRYIMDPSKSVTNVNSALFARILAALTAFAVFVSMTRLKRENSSKKNMVDKTKTPKAFMERARSLTRLDQEPVEVLAKAEDILTEILRSKYSVSVSSLTRNEVKSLLSEKNVNIDVVNSCESLLERCENLRYAPGAAQPNLARQVADDLTQLIQKIYS